MAQYYDIKKKACTGSTSSLCSGSQTLDFQVYRNGALAYFGNNYYNAKYMHLRDMGDVHGVRNGTY